MRRVVLAVAVLTPVVLLCEIALFLRVVALVGWGWALLMVLAPMPLGVWLVRREGALGWRRLRAEVIAGKAPATAVAHGALGLLGGVLVVLPGFLSDVIGLLLVGPLRGWAVKRVTGLRIGSGDFGPRRVRGDRGGGGEDGPVVEGEVVER